MKAHILEKNVDLTIQTRLQKKIIFTKNVT